MSKSRAAIWAASLVLGLGMAVAVNPAAAQDKGKSKGPSISKGIVKPIQAAQAAIKGNKWSECVSQLRQADATPNKTGYDDHAISELLGFCAIRTNDYSTAAKALETGLNSGFLDKDQVPSRIRALAQVNYQIKNYGKAVEFGRKAVSGGFADADMYILVAQAYYIQNDYKTTQKFVGDWVDDLEKRGQTPRENALQLLLSSCLKLDDNACVTHSLERLVAGYPKDEYWQNLMSSMFRSGGNDKAMVNVYRLTSVVNAMRRPEDYTEMAQLAIEAGVPGEAQAALETAFSRKVFTDQRDIDKNNRLLATAKTQAATDKTTLARQDKDAAAAKTGDSDVKLGQAYLSYGQLPQALTTIQRGIAKGGLKNPAEAQLLLGIAQLKSGNKSEAVKSFKAVKGDEVLTRLGKLWAIHAAQ